MGVPNFQGIQTKGFELTGEVDPMFKEPTWALTLKPLKI